MYPTYVNTLAAPESEYQYVNTLAGLAGLLYKMLSGGFGEQLLHTLFDHVLGLLGLG